MGASAIKFLELLVLDDRENDYGLYYDMQAIQKHTVGNVGNNASSIACAGLQAAKQACAVRVFSALMLMGKLPAPKYFVWLFTVHISYELS